MSERTASLDDFDSTLSESSRSAPEPKPAQRRNVQSELEYPGGWAALEMAPNEAKPNMKYPGFFVEVMRHLDADIHMTRDWATSHACYFDPMMAPQGSYAFNTSVVKNQSSITAQYANGTILGDARTKYKDFTLGCSAHLYPQQAAMTMMGGGMIPDDFKASVKYKGSSYSIASDVGSSGVSLAYLRTVWPGIATGAKISRVAQTKEVQNSYFLRFRNRSQKDTLQVLLTNEQQRHDMSVSYIKKVTPHSKLVTSLQVHPTTKNSSWWFGYAFNFPNTGSQIQAMVDSDFKVALGASCRLPNLDPFALNFFGEIDHKTGQHKLCAGLQIQVPSEEQAQAQEEMMKQMRM